MWSNWRSQNVPLFARDPILQHLPIMKQRKLVLNIKNMKGSLCFIYSVLAALYLLSKIKTDRRVTGNLSIVTSTLEKCQWILLIYQKNYHLKVSVFAYECSKVYPAFISNKSSAKLINLLLLPDENNWHYCFMKTLDRVLKVLLRSAATSWCLRV